MPGAATIAPQPPSRVAEARTKLATGDHDVDGYDGGAGFDVADDDEYAAVD